MIKLKQVNRKSIAILGTRGIPARYGGFETFAEEIAVRLIQFGIEVTVFCEAGGQQPKKYRGVKLDYVSTPNLGPLTTIWFDLVSLWRARRGFNVIYMLGYGAGFFCFIPKLWGRRVWINMDGIEWERSKWSWLAKWWLKMMEALSVRVADRLIADAEGIRMHLENRYRYLPPLSVIPYGARVVDDPPEKKAVYELDIRPNEYYLVICRLEPENHVLDIVQGFIETDSVHKLVIVGDYSTGTSYVKRLLGINDSRLQFTGAIYNKSKIQALRYYAIAYFHGHSVGGTNPSLLEAMGCSNLIVAHDNIFNREVAEGAALFFSNAKDISGFVEDIERLPSSYDCLRVNARERLLSKYTWDKVISKYLDLLEGEEKL